MALFLYDFHCPECNRVFEEFAKPEQRSATCPDIKCGAQASRLLCAPTVDYRPFVFSARASSEPAIDKWDKMRKKKIEVERRKLKEHGTYE